MDCPEARDHLPDLGRDGLPEAVAHAVRAHLTECAACRQLVEDETRVRSLIRERLTRYTAPPALRVRVRKLALQPPDVRPAWRRWLAWPRLASGLAAATAVVALVWAGSLWLFQDPTSRLAGEALREHREYVQETMPRIAPDPERLLAPLPQQIGFEVGRVFVGDPEVQLVSAVPSELAGAKAAALVYRNAAGRYSTLFLSPADVRIPDESRLAIQTYRPHHRVVRGRHLLLWKQRNLTHVLVTDLPEVELPAMFLKIRTAT
jgi:hypothetical protein